MTADLVYYHHPDDDQFSLDFVNPDREMIDDRLESYDDSTETRVRSYHLDEEVYAIYAKTNEVDDTEKSSTVSTPRSPRWTPTRESSCGRFSKCLPAFGSKSRTKKVLR